MKKPPLFKFFHRLYTFAVFMALLTVCYSFNVKKTRCTRICKQSQFHDTLRYTSPSIFKWGQIPKLIPFDGKLIAFDGKDSLLFERKDYETYARENQETDNFFKV